MFSAVLWLFKSFCSALWLYNILVANDVANCDRLWDPLGHGEHIYIWFPRLYCIADFNKTKFPNPCHALKNSVAVKGSSHNNEYTLEILLL